MAHSTKNALRGLGDAFRNDESFRLEVVVGIPVLIVFLAFVWPIPVIQLLFLFTGFMLIYISELINTSVEKLLDKLHPVRHKVIGLSKDIASAAVFLAFMYTGVVALIILLSKFGILSM